MRRRESARVPRWLAWLRAFLIAITGLVTLLWVSSYWIGIQRYQSHWVSIGGAEVERATWVVSNYGSLGLAWRSQDGVLEGALPASESELKVFDSSPSAWAHVHPEGTSSWHWIQYEQAESTAMGSMRTCYGHFFVPYWMLMLAGSLSAFMISLGMRRRSNKGLVEGVN